MELCLPPVLFVICIVTYLSVGFRSILLPPRAPSSAGGQPIVDQSICLGVSRYSDYAFVHIPVGSDLKDLKLLLRLDTFKNSTDTQPTVQIASQKVLESDSIVCSPTSVCSDAALLISGGPNGNRLTFKILFEYQQDSSHDAMLAVAMNLGADGQMLLRRDNVYSLTSTHLCWQKSDANS